jgi:hypothetical protein
MKKWQDHTTLGLLDDFSGAEPPARAWEDMMRATTRPAPTAEPKVVTTVTVTAPKRSKAPPPARTVFSSQPTLRQMMHDYNGRSAGRPPIKSVAVPTDATAFRFESVDLINIPNIPGKILRPARR